MKLSLVIPCYNEAENIPYILERIRDVMVAGAGFLEVILVDNGSKDNSPQVLEAELEKAGNQAVITLRVEVNQGYGYGILAGFQVARGEYLAWTHADMQTDPIDVWKAFEKLLSLNDAGHAVVKGRRKNRHFLERFFTFGMQLVVWQKLRCWLSDINAQPKVFSRKFFDLCVKPQAPYDFSLDLYLLYQARLTGAVIATVPVYFAKRLRGEAKGGSGSNMKTRIKLIKRTFAYINELAQGKVR